MAEDFTVQQVPEGDWQGGPQVTTVSKDPIKVWEPPTSVPTDFVTNPTAKRKEQENFYGWRRENKEPKPIMLKPAEANDLPQYVKEPAAVASRPDDLEID